MARLVVAIIVLAVSAGGATRLVSLYRENAALRRENAELRAGRPPAPASAPRAAVVPGMSALPRTLDPARRKVMLDTLAAHTGAERKVWFQVDQNDRESSAFQKELEGVFREAGWAVAVTGAGGLRFKPGIRLLVADEEWPGYASAASDALEAAGVEFSSAVGYRAYYDEQTAATPGWRGPKLEPDQTYVLLIGPVG